MNKTVFRIALCPLALVSVMLMPASALAQDGSAAANPDADGPLDRSYPELQRATQPVQLPANVVAPQVVTTTGGLPSEESQTGNTQNAEAFDLDQIRDEVQREQTSLEQLDRDVLQDRAELGERAAQVALGVEFARESTLLSFSPAAANDALSDAIRWYSLAARRGYPGAPSLDQAGVRFFPVRASRQ